MEIKKVTLEESSKIIETRQPKGLFYVKDGDTYTGIDNRAGDAWTEDFKQLTTCKKWLKEANK